VAVAIVAGGLAGCAPVAPRGSPAGAVESELLGPFPRSGCFHVALIGPDRYRFVIDDVEYPPGLGAGHVAIIARAVDIGDLRPRPVALPRSPQLAFTAEGEASGAFELTLLLIDDQGVETKPTRLDRICRTAVAP